MTTSFNKFWLFSQRPPHEFRCSFFQLRDLKMCSRTVELLPSFMERIKQLEEENKLLLQANRRYITTILIFLVIVIWLIISRT